MKILLLVPNLEGHASGGVGNIYKVTELPKHGDIHYFYVNSAKPRGQVLSVLGLMWKYLTFLLKLLTGSYDLVHVNPSLNSKSFYRDGMFVRLAKLVAVPVLTFFHGWENDFESQIRNSPGKTGYFNRSFARSDKFIVLGQIFKDKLIGLGANPNTPFFIETTIADDNYLPRLNLQKKIASFDQEIKVLFISRIVKEKGIYIALDAFKEVYGDLPDKKLSFLIAGTGPELEAAKQYVEQNNIKHVDFLGFVSGDAKGDLLIDAHVLLFPTYYGEGLPCTILEAMLYGMPVISRINAGIPDIVTNDTHGYLSHEKDPGIYAQFLKTILQDKALFSKMSRANHQLGMDRFTSSQVRDRILGIYQSFSDGS